MTAAPATLERATAKDIAKERAETEKQRHAEIAKLERQFLNVNAIREWAKMQPVPMVLDNHGQQAVGFEVDPAMLARITDELVAAFQDKATSEYEGKVRQGKVPEGRPHILT